MKIKTSFIATVFNEEDSIIQFLESIFNQSILPNEIIIVDGGSTDNTLSEISKFKFPKIKNPPNIKILFKKGNRSIGRNEAIKNAKGDIILSSDAGCVLEKDWVKEVLKPFENKNVDVVAGYYKGIAKNSFQKSLIPYALVMKDRANENDFLPATRSMAFKKSIWEKLGGFNEKLSHNEDYEFANRLKEQRARIVFAKNAIVDWIPRKNLKEAFIMFFRFALGDAESGIFRDKVVFIFLRYIFAAYLMIMIFIEKSIFLNSFLILGLFFYIFWSIKKNYKYVGNPLAFLYLPLLQFSSDFAVIFGTTLGLVKSLSINLFATSVLKNKGVFFVIIIYTLFMLSVITYGIPNSNHPFDYFMDEWHQSQSVRDLFKYGTPNIPGAANGSIFQFFLTGLYLVPFYLLHIVNFFAIKSSVTNLDMQYTLFEVLRLNTLFFGIASIALIGYIAKKYFKINPFIASFLFAINPLWLMLSNYYKYDIAMTFWIIVSFLFFLKYIEKPTISNFIFGGIFSGIALSTKLLTPLPLVVTYIFMFFAITKDAQKKFMYLFIGLILCGLTYFFFGNLDIFLGRGSLNDYLYSNLIIAPKLTGNFKLGSDIWTYLFIKLYPTMFGKFFYFSFWISLMLSLFYLSKKFLNKNERKTLTKYSFVLLLTVTYFLFLGELIPAKIQALNNRMLVLLPFMALYSGLLLESLSKRVNKKIFVILIIILFLFQFIESYSWFPIKWSESPRQTSSSWILKNVPAGSTIGVESIPIYQMLPDIVQKEFYFKQYNQKINYKYNYQVVSPKSKFLPKYIVISNDEIENTYLNNSPKKDLLAIINKDGYKKIVTFVPDFKYYKIFNGEFEYYMSGIVQAPDTISIYEK